MREHGDRRGRTTPAELRKEAHTMRWRTLVCAVLLAVTASVSVADVPQTMSYQGVLKDAGGSMVPDDDYVITFSIHDVDVGGAALWMEAQTLPVSGGIFNAVLGSATPLNILFDQPYWLGVAIEADPELEPRVELTAAPYAMRALYADNGADDDWVISGSDVYRLTGRVGIGTPTPEYALDVADTARVLGLVMPTGAADGHVLTSDAAGVASWQPGGGTGDLTGVIAGEALSGGGTEGDVTLDVNAGAGLAIAADTLGLAGPYLDGGAFVNEGQADAVTADMVLPDVISTLDGVANDAGDIDLIEGENITITPDDVGNTITIAATGNGDVTAVYGDDGLTGGGDAGDIHLGVGPGDGIAVSADSVSVVAAALAGAGLADDGTNDLAIVTGAGLEVVADTLGLTDAYATGAAYDAAFVNEGQADAVTTDMVVPNILSGINGVTNDGGEIQFIEGSNIQILTNDELNTITFAAAGTLSGDITAVIAEDGLYGGADFADAHLWVGDGDGIVADADSIHVQVSDFAGAGLVDDGSNNIDVNTGAGLAVVADTLTLTVPYRDGTAYDAVFVNEGQADAVSTDMLVPDVVSSLDGVANDGGDIDLVEGDNITITPDDTGNTITIAATGSGDITGVEAGSGLAGGGTEGDVTLDVVTGPGLAVVADTLGLTLPYQDGSAYDTVFVNEGQVDAVTADMVVPDVVSSLDGVANDAGDIDLVEGENITITPDDEANTITISVAAGGDGDWSFDGDNIYSTVPGNVGIGEPLPDTKLHVAGDAKVTGTVYTNKVSSMSPLELQTGDVTRVFVDDVTGNVGVGVTTPVEKMEVDGAVRMTGLQLTTGPGDGLMLTSDASGVGTWQNPVDVLIPLDASADAPLTAVIGATNTTLETGFAAGVQGSHAASGTFGYLGGENIGVMGIGAIGTGVEGLGAIGVKGTGSTAGIQGIGSGPVGVGVFGSNLTGYAGYFEGNVLMTGFELPTGSAEGYVLTAGVGGSGTWQAIPPSIAGTGDPNRIPKFVDEQTLGNSAIFESGGTVSIGLVAARGDGSPRLKRGDTRTYGRLARRFVVAADNAETGHFSVMETDALEDGRTAIYALRDREWDVPNDGSGYGVGETNNAITGYNYWGDLYTFGVAGYSYNDEKLTGGVLGAEHEGDYWGALGYRDIDYHGWGVYTPNDTYVGGNLGIGIDDPQAKLDVAGTAQVTGLTMPTGASTGYVLTSDAFGAATWEAPSSSDITAVYADDGLTGGAETGDAHLAVGAGDGISVSADDVSLVAADIAGAGLADDGANNLAIVTGAGLAVVADTLGLTVPYQDGSAYDAVFVNEGQADAVGAGMIVPDVVSSLDGVANDAGDIDLVEGANITITPDDLGNTITIAATGGGDITAVTAGSGLTGGGTEGDVTLDVLTGAGLTVLADAVELTVPYQDGSAYDAVFVNEGQTSSITGDMIADGAVTDADVATGAAIDPAKISGTAWTALNDGTGSGLDADTVDGLDSSDLATATHEHDAAHIDDEAGEVDTAADFGFVAPTHVANMDADLLDGQEAASFATTVHEHDAAYVNDDSGEVDTAADFGFVAPTHVANMDADLLDGQEAASFATTVHEHDAAYIDDEAGEVDTAADFGFVAPTYVANLDSDLLDGQEAASFATTVHEHDDAYVNEGQADAVSVAMISTDVVSSLDGVANDGGDIDLIAGSNVTITPDDIGNAITIAATDPADGDWTVSGGDVYSAVAGNVGVGTSSPARKLHISDVLRLEPRADFPASPSDGDICVMGDSGSRHIYCYLNGSWMQLDPAAARRNDVTE